jgi:hypothetical protein
LSACTAVALAVVAELVRADTMGCWAAVYDAVDVSADDASAFAAKHK